MYMYMYIVLPKVSNPQIFFPPLGYSILVWESDLEEERLMLPVFHKRGGYGSFVDNGSTLLADASIIPYIKNL
jgi:hypothetical protein